MHSAVCHLCGCYIPPPTNLAPGRFVGERMLPRDEPDEAFQYMVIEAYSDMVWDSDLDGDMDKELEPQPHWSTGIVVQPDKSILVCQYGVRM